MAVKIYTMTIRIMAPDLDSYATNETFDQRNEEVIASLGRAWSMAEDAINDVLPEGFYCKIEE